MKFSYVLFALLFCSSAFAADKRITDFPSATAAASDEVPIWQSGATKKDTAGAIANLITASNGLTKTSSDIALGGTLTGDTTLALSTHALTFTGSSSGVIAEILTIEGAANAPIDSLVDYGLYVSPIIHSVTAPYYTGVGSSISTDAVAVTADIYNFYAVDGVKGVGSTITNNWGFYADGMAYGTNNYGFYSTITAASNNWAFYGAGTAKSHFGGTVDIQGVPVAGVYRGTTGSISGALTAGVCDTGTATVTGATTSMVASASPATYPGDGVVWKAYVSSSDTVTVKVCGLAVATPTASVYNVAVFP